MMQSQNDHVKPFTESSNKITQFAKVFIICDFPDFEMGVFIFVPNHSKDTVIYIYEQIITKIV